MWSSEPPGGDAERRGRALLRLSISVHVSFNTPLKFPHWASQQVDTEEVREGREGKHTDVGVTVVTRGASAMSCCYCQHQQGETVALHGFQFNL